MCTCVCICGVCEHVLADVCIYECVCVHVFVFVVYVSMFWQM